MFLMIAVREPIFVVGAARSGTTLLAEILAKHTDIAYWVEPKYIWRYRDAAATSDVRSPKSATKNVRMYITNIFDKFLRRSGKKRFLEKTPSNCFRMEFMREIFPDGKFIILYRDGRDVTLSAAKKWTSSPDPSALRRRLGAFEIPLRDFPFYVISFFRDVIARNWHSRGGYVWGPFFPGIKEVRATHSVEETCAIQWSESVKAIARALKVFPDDSYLVVKYENLLKDPTGVVNDVMHFCGIESEANVIKEAEDRVAAYLQFGKPKIVDKAIMRKIRTLAYKELLELGYIEECTKN